MMEWKAKARGVWICWDEDDFKVERRDAGTVHDRTVVTERSIKVARALWSNEVSPKTIAAAEEYALTIADQYANVRVEARERDVS